MDRLTSRPRSGFAAPAGSIDRAWFEVQERVQRHHWWYRGRRALLARLLPRLIPAGRRARILDVGSGVGVNAQLLARFGDLVLVDKSPEALSRADAGSGTTCCRADASRLPFRAGTFDLACALDVLEHLEDDRGAVHELASALAPGGRLLVMVPAFDFLWGPQDDVSHHVRRYRRADLVALVRSAGFRIDRVWYFNFALFAPILAARKLIRALGWKVESENELTPGLVNTVLERLFSSESRLSLGVSYPVGVSLGLVATLGGKRTAPRP